MPRKSKKISKEDEIEVPRFASEADEADWYASREGQRFAEQTLRRGIREGTVKVYPAGENFRRTDPAKLQDLVDRARAAMTKAVSLRIPNRDLATAKRIAEKKGIGYQTVLKQAIREGLRHT